MARLKEKKSTDLKAKRRSLPDLDNTHTKGKELALPQQQIESDDKDEPESADRDVDMSGIIDDNDDENGKDDVEEELERLVFGDSAGFREGLRDFGGAAVDDDEGDAQDDGLEGIADNDLFFTDVGGDNAPLLGQTEDEEEEKDRAAAAWEDSDDERVVVSLASVPRLRKLRRTEGEDLVTGKEYMRRLRRQFEMLNPVPDWASDATRPAKKRKVMNADDEDDMEIDDEEDVVAEPLGALLRDGGALVRRSEAAGGKKRKLRPETLDIQRTKDIEGTQPSAITSLSFHRELPLLLSSGPASTLYLHHIQPSPPAPSPNPLLTSLHVKGTPLETSAFHPKDTRVFLSARRRYFHVWDLESGRVEKVTRIYGHQTEQRTMEHFKLSPDGKLMALMGSAKKGGGVINILDAYTLQWSSQVRIESRGGIADFCWWSDSRGLTVVGKNGEVTEWDVQQQRVTARWQDEGAVGTTTLSMGGNNGFPGASIGTDRWVAIGSSSGVVNIYDRRAWLSNPTAAGAGSHQPIPKTPKPTRTLDQLTTPTSHLVFSPDGQMLIMASRWKKDALRIIHLPTCTVYKNWPTSNTPLGRITGVAFGPGSDVLAAANEAGKIRMWEIRS
ncbi:hypothetical protein MBLNU457_7300t2 [Dothideomycetes sp. NU457]